MEPGPRRSIRLRAKGESKSVSNLKARCKKYIEHIYTLHDVSSDLLTMTDTLSERELKEVISKYESLIGDLLKII